MHHGIEHLGGSDDDLAPHFGQMDDVLLVDGHFLQRNFDTQVSAGHHDAVGDVEDLVDIVDALGALDLGDDLHSALMGIEDLPDQADIIGRPGEGSCDIFIAHLAAEFDVGPVLLADKGHGQVGIGDIDALVVGDGASVDDGAVDLRIGNAVDSQFDQAVIDQDHAALGDIFGQVLVADGGALCSSHDFFGRQCEFAAFFQHDLTAIKVAEADFGALGIHQCGYRNTHLSAEADQALEFCLVLLMGSMGEIKSRHVHARIDQFAQRLFALACRTDRADDFCLAHSLFLLTVLLSVYARENPVFLFLFSCLFIYYILLPAFSK